MTPSSASPSHRGLNAVCFAAAILVCGIAAGLHLSVPDEIADYVSNGLVLPAYRYGLLAILIACGLILSSERHPIALAAHLVVFALAIGFGLRWVEPLVLSHEPLAEFIVGNPVLTTAMGMITGIALILPLRARWWCVPFVSASCGIGLGLFMVLESPFDYNAGWYSLAGGLGGLAVVVVSIALADCARRMIAGSWLPVAERIIGSWLIAASLMLAALAVVTDGSLEIAPLLTEDPDSIGYQRQP